MINILKSDLYKLFLRRSFYVCALINGAFGVFLVVLLNKLYDVGSVGFNGIRSITVGTGEVSILASIFLSMFVASEFSAGTIRNSVSKGISRVQIYLSKLLIGIFTCVSYVLFGGLCGFVSGSIMWGVGSVDSGEAWEIVKILALFLLAEICLQSVFIMVGFLVRNTGGTVAINLGISILMGQVILPMVDYVVKNWALLGHTIDSSEYWVGTYTSTFVNMYVEQDVINKGIVVCLAYFVVATLVGILDFCRRDI